MPQFVYRFVELFSYIGNTPEDPGGDFGIAFRIDAPNATEAKRWGKIALEDYVRLRYRFATDPPDPKAYEGELVDVSEAPDAYEDIPSCTVGEMPVWNDPWKDWPHAKKET